MGGFSVWHWVIVLGIIVLLFGRGRISRLLGEVGQGIGIVKRHLKG
ncbi:sec-independent protein translocase protein TatA [Rhizobium sp. BK591]|nr:twin-arginine translocase TatA/TatE family subunit [Rhizobium sp. BK591]MBB3743082.1 sec-independent protein translocase protein TatA [Rhizobium sp. BK591]